MQTGNGPAKRHAVDASRRSRPGVPQKRAPSPAGKPHWVEPDRQPSVPGVLKDTQHEELTATFGTGQPPKGVSGAMRRLAYRIPDYRIRRWLILMLADRVDTLEWRLASTARSPVVWAGLVALAGAGVAFALAGKRAPSPRRLAARAAFGWLAR